MESVVTRKLDDSGGVLHLQFVQWRRLRAKQAHYKMTEVIRWPDKLRSAINNCYDPAVDETGLQISPVPVEWLSPYEDLFCYLDLNGDPWQEAECKELNAKWGAEKFAGLNLFGVLD